MADGDSTERQLAIWERRFYACLLLGVSMGLVSLVTKMDWLAFPEAASWAGAGVCSIQMGRVLRRAGHDASGMVLRGVAMFVLALATLISALT
ncbi:MAG TPA: hypothetical protein RMH85_20960 [Polyangiaceae bacterium LLY-WYZ-15_(1-7)]|nr:hypothetical protein [Myxococcales bacterium]MAT26852.1 hypothetical protein [Sandaracinus sp.]HJK89246.1 hypothetical protein [Polyangiaceae bacterium LLY-WYZ-15_(1-7)]MBJ69917.1 hypothetical protein [Sandaracinus sp.]HJL02721.1 hypothetical protein [Polyangiaceae bacterium LLY-WYZ-15_(1-7)]